MRIKYILFLSLLFTSLLMGGCQQEEQKLPVKESESVAKSEKATFTDEDKVVTIAGKVFTYEDLQFYELMNKVDIELNRQQDEQQLQGDKLKDQLAYWDEQIAYHDNFNVNLAKMIQQHTMYLLAQEKGLSVNEAEVTKNMTDFAADVAQYERASQLVQAFPKDAYQNRLHQYFSEKLLNQQIYETLKNDVIKEKPSAAENEIAYQTAKNFDELYQSQIATLEIKINAAEQNQ
jgi:hypothetical protein